MNLSELKIGDKAVVAKIKGHGSFQKRIMEMGFVKGKSVKVIKNAPFGGPVEYRIMDYHVTLRKSEASLIEVVTPEMAAQIPALIYEGTIDEATLKTSAQQAQKKINVALVGNPNCGKTSLFNYLSGAHERVGNYSGVTVESKTAIYKQDDYVFNLVDLPGTYSLTAYSPEELFVRKFIFKEHPDIVINVVDASNLERNLYLTTQLIDMDIKVVLALNMYDDLEQSGSSLDIKSLEKLMGIPIIPTVATKGIGTKELFKEVIATYENKNPIVRHIHINYGKEVEKSIQILRDAIEAIPPLRIKTSPRFLALKLLEQDKQAIRMCTKFDVENNLLKTAYKEIERIEGLRNETGETIITNAKYGFINGALQETLQSGKHKRRKKSNKIDKVLTHPLWGFPIFLFFIFLMFLATFNIGAYPMDWIDAGIGLLNNFVKTTLPQGMLNDLLTDGIISGCGSVVIFLPNIVILFLFISFMEDTGYMARASFMMDKFMHKIGLHGRSFIPLIMGFGCNVPAIMATRTIRNQNDRLLTILITPFMSCSARLPVYILFIGAFFPEKPTLVLMSLYGLGILLAISSAHLFNKTLFKTKETPFVMELPPYRIPSLRSTLIHMWEKAGQYLKKVGSVILIAVIIIWALGYFPKHHDIAAGYDQQIAQVEAQQDVSGSNQDAIEAEIHQLEFEKNKELLANSYLGKIGKFIEPVIRPLGFDWHMGIALLTGTAAKEVVISTMGVLMQTASEDDGGEQLLAGKLKNLKHERGKHKGEAVFNPIIAFAFLVFILIYFPCVGVVSAIARESGLWKWAFFTIGYTTALAWIAAFIVKQIGSLFL